MKKENTKNDKNMPENTEENTPQNTRKGADNSFPDYPLYPAKDDIYNQSIESDLNPDNLEEMNIDADNPGLRNEKDFSEDETGEDLDVPGSEDDEAENNEGNEDEENNYYSLGGDNHNDLEEERE